MTAMVPQQAAELAMVLKQALSISEIWLRLLETCRI
jgi:hypothetical protein